MPFIIAQNGFNPAELIRFGAKMENLVVIILSKKGFGVIFEIVGPVTKVFIYDKNLSLTSKVQN